jgi:hypothetical protein
LAAALISIEALFLFRAHGPDAARTEVISLTIFDGLLSVV